MVCANFEVKIQILDKVRFLPGMTATVDIKTEIKHNIFPLFVIDINITQYQGYCQHPFYRVRQY